MTLPFTTFPIPTTLLDNASITATNTTVANTLANRFGGFSTYISVKDFGAKGDGITDDTAAIQAAINVAFHTATANAISQALQNQAPLFFPVGNYRITAALNFTSIFGARIIGAGRLSTQITQATASTDIFYINGMKDSIIDGIAFVGSGNTAIGIDLDFDNIVAVNTESNTIRDCFFTGLDIGILIGKSGFQASETIMINNYFISNNTGIKVVNFNALSNNVYGGNFQSNTTGIWVSSGSCPVISGVGFQLSSAVDILISNSGNDSMSIVGCRTESANFAHIHFQDCAIIGCNQQGSSGFFAKADDQAQLSLIGCITINGQLQNNNNPTANVDSCQFGRDDWGDAGSTALYRNLYTGKTVLGTGSGTRVFHSNGLYNATANTYIATFTDLNAAAAAVLAKGSAIVVQMQDTETSGHIWDVSAGVVAGIANWHLYDRTADRTPFVSNLDNAGSFQLRRGGTFAWSSDSNFADGAAADTGISRVAPVSSVSTVAFGNGTAGDGSATILAKTKAGAPAASDVPAGTWALIRDTSGGTTKLYYNNAGVLMTVALT